VLAAVGMMAAVAAVRARRLPVSPGAERSERS